MQALKIGHWWLREVGSDFAFAAAIAAVHYAINRKYPVKTLVVFWGSVGLLNEIIQLILGVGRWDDLVVILLGTVITYWIAKQPPIKSSGE